MDNFEGKAVKSESHEEIKPLNAVPIFRSNELFRNLFPEVSPAFEQGEKVTLTKALEAVLAHPNQKVILDGTTAQVINSAPLDESTTLADYPAELELETLPKNGKEIHDILREKFGIIILDNSIDGTIQDTLFGEASFEEVADGFFEIIKKKNPNTKKIYLVTDNIADHVLGRKQDTEGVLAEIESTAYKCFGDSLEIVRIQTSEAEKLTGTLAEDEHLILDRHAFRNYFKLDPAKISILPLETELYRSQKFFNGETSLGENLTSKLRQKFEE